MHPPNLGGSPVVGRVGSSERRFNSPNFPGLPRGPGSLLDILVWFLLSPGGHLSTAEETTFACAQWSRTRLLSCFRVPGSRAACGPLSAAPWGPEASALRVTGAPSGPVPTAARGALGWPKLLARSVHSSGHW